mmetsp:Transcript_36460/g.85187  ORF Transcript_36460/g.85187 Transcript_36460/m.85187 type:complete len:89 (+) Transcript_36460:576-842(+)
MSRFGGAMLMLYAFRRAIGFLLRAAICAPVGHVQSCSRCTAQVMQKFSADTEFVTKESTRLKRMMEDGSVKASKKEQFGRRLNVLSSF